MRFSLPIVLLLASAVPASANEWRAMRAEYAAEFENARMMATLDCVALDANVEQQRWMLNRRTYAEYHRMTPAPMVARPAVIPGYSPPVAPPRPR